MRCLTPDAYRKIREVLTLIAVVSWATVAFCTLIWGGIAALAMLLSRTFYMEGAVFLVGMAALLATKSYTWFIQNSLPCTPK